MLMFLSELLRVMAKEAIPSSTLSFPDYNILPTGDKWEVDHKESWAPKHWCFWTMVLKKRVPWTTRRSNQSVLKDISLEYSLGGLMLKLKVQHFGHLMRRTDSLEKTLIRGKIEGRRKRGWQRMMWLDGITDSMDMSLSKLPEFIRTHVHWVGDAIQPSHPLLSPSALTLSQYQGLFQWVSSSYQVAKELEYSFV